MVQISLTCISLHLYITRILCFKWSVKQKKIPADCFWFFASSLFLLKCWESWHFQMWSSDQKGFSKYCRTPDVQMEMFLLAPSPFYWGIFWDFFFLFPCALIQKQLCPRNSSLSLSNCLSTFCILRDIEGGAQESPRKDKLKPMSLGALTWFRKVFFWRGFWENWKNQGKRWKRRKEDVSY